MTLTATFTRLKPVILAVAIAIGLIVQCHGARAAATEYAFFAGGCFWCVESDFEQVKGVGDVISGFTGGKTKNPTYKQVGAGGTGHYEAVQVPYDPAQVSYEDLLDLFFRAVDPTDSGGQFCDRGDSYRTAIFVTSDAQRAAAEKAKAAAQQALGRTIVTPIVPFTAFYPADEYHQDYYKKSDLVLTRRGPKTKASAYKFYRDACGRDQRVKQLWDKNAAFTH